MKNAAIIGAPGYAGVELTRLLIGHPEFELAVVTSTSEAGRAVGDVYPSLSPFTDLVYEPPDSASISGVDIAFLAVPHTAAMSIAPDLIDSGIVVVDASADFRLKDSATYEAWYNTAHAAPALLGSAVYGLPELDRSGMLGANLIACPGCYPTAAILAALPALQAGVVSSSKVVIDAKSGVSGAGRTPSAATHYPATNESLTPYKVGTHRHTPEIVQALSGIAGVDVGVVFTPHLVPMTRGLLATVYMDLKSQKSADEIHGAYIDRYSGEPFVTLHPAGKMPATSEVRGSNRAHIGLAVDESTNTLVVACAIDNLVKGTSGQAVQCANLVFGLEETAGLDHPLPVI